MLAFCQLASLTDLSLIGNGFGDEGVATICNAVKENKETKLATLNIGCNGVTSAGVLPVAAMLAVTGSLTSCDVRGNNISGEAASQLSAAVLANINIEQFNEIPVKEMRADSLTTRSSCPRRTSALWAACSWGV